ncbi:MAG TPA: orotidine-5'-phosphate decarboxylase [Acidimicrobiales bacterium]|nr:orotidine-5'-phosphate decarboxylase [Acidimicrobiales bacterium]
MDRTPANGAANAPGTGGAQGAPEGLRARFALALDVDDLVVALRLTRLLAPWFGTAKVGLELFSAAGPDAVSSVRDVGVDVFADLKLHDIPTTVGRAARVLGALGVRYLTLHAAGGPAVLRAGAEGLRAGAADVGLPEPVALAVTVLTSEPEAHVHVLHQRVMAGLEAGCGGFVCAAPDIAAIRQLAPRAVLVTPGIRPAGAPADDQARVATPADALAAGADLLVVGRPVTRADDPVDAARRLVAEAAAG